MARSGGRERLRRGGPDGPDPRWIRSVVTEYRVLGPLEVMDDGRPLALGGQKQRALLALLLIHAGETLSVDRIVDELWGENPPRTATRSLQNLVHNLRKVLGAEV